MTTTDIRKEAWLEYPRLFRIAFWHVWLMDRVTYKDYSIPVKIGLCVVAFLWILFLTTLVASPVLVFF